MIVEPGAFRTKLASAAMKHKPIMDEYRDVVGGTRDFAHGMDGTQDGDPLKAASAMDQALRSAETPLRLQLEQDGIDAVRGHAEKLLNDLQKWVAVGAATRLNTLTA